VRPLRLGEEKKEDRKKPQHENIMVCLIPYGHHKNKKPQGKNTMACLILYDGHNKGRQVQS